MKRHYFDVQFEKNETYFAFCLGKINFAKKRETIFRNSEQIQIRCKSNLREKNLDQQNCLVRLNCSKTDKLEIERDNFAFIQQNWKMKLRKSSILCRPVIPNTRVPQKSWVVLIHT